MKQQHTIHRRKWYDKTAVWEMIERRMTAFWVSWWNVGPTWPPATVSGSTKNVQPMSGPADYLCRLQLHNAGSHWKFDENSSTKVKHTSAQRFHFSLEPLWICFIPLHVNTSTGKYFSCNPYVVSVLHPWPTVLITPGFRASGQRGEIDSFTV